jgi:hypothetical protein
MRIIQVDREAQDEAVPLRFHFNAWDQLFDDSDPRPIPLAEMTELAEDSLFSYTDEYVPRKPVGIEIDLPENELPPHGEQLIPEAICRHFSNRIPELEHELKLIQRDGVYSLILMILTAIAFGIFVFAILAVYTPGIGLP